MFAMKNLFARRLAREIRPSRFFLPILLCAALVSAALIACAAPNASPAPSAIPTQPRAVTFTTQPTAQNTATSAPTRAQTQATVPQPMQTKPRAHDTATPVPTPIPQTVAPELAPGVVAYESTVTINAYPYEKFWIEKRDPVSNVTFRAFNRDAYEAAQNSLRAEPKTFRAIVLENEYLKITLLPELGGRIYQIEHKQSGKKFLYNNPVLKPTRWGLSEQSGWLAAGGIEWAFPKQEHGYEWNAPWDARIERDASGVSVLLTDTTTSDRPRVQVRVTLPARSAYVAVSPRAENPTDKPQRVQFWDNAMLNLGASETLSPRTEFILQDAVLIHSTGNDWIPKEFVPAENATAPQAPVSFSNLAGRDLRVYKNWDNYLGVFAADTTQSDLAQAFVGAYNYETNMGFARVFTPQLTPGAKFFAWGPNFCCADLYTDARAEYFEMWGGINRTFFPDDDVILQPGETRAWSEYFIPLPDTNGIRAARQDFALNMQRDGDSVNLTAYAAAPRKGVLILKQGAREIQRWDIALDATRALSAQVKTSERPLTLELQDRDGNLLLQTAE